MPRDLIKGLRIFIYPMYLTGADEVRRNISVTYLAKQIGVDIDWVEVDIGMAFEEGVDDSYERGAKDPGSVHVFPRVDGQYGMAFFEQIGQARARLATMAEGLQE
ncbi:MAG: hypothetical protein KAJ73_00170 [Zetaproteobacteria bacterium]|nr:hypothetical protein [Zetaproteobacteria bacterium]